MSDRQLTAALAGSAAATAAASGPATTVVPGARPWRWVLHTGSLDLFADRGRPTTALDTTDRLTLLTCGEALHRARVALAAEGRSARVAVLPDADPDHIATITAAERIAVTDTARARFEASGSGPWERRSGAGLPSEEAIAALATAAAGEGLQLLTLDRDQVVAMAAATAVPRGARARISEDETTVYAVLAGEGDGAKDWIRAGSALSAVWVEAIQRGLSIAPSTAVVELPASRRILRRVLPGLGTPYLALRIGARPPAPDQRPGEGDS